MFFNPLRYRKDNTMQNNIISIRIIQRSLNAQRVS